MTPGPAVIDTNVVVSGVLTRLVSPTARILDGMLSGRFRYLLSLELLAEYREVLLRPKIRKRHGLSDTEVDVLLTEIAANGVVVEPAGSAKKGRVGGDEHLWELVAAVDPAILVTGDRMPIDEPVSGARVMTVRAFADSLEE